MNTKKGPEVDGAVLGVLAEHRKGGAITDLSAALRTLTEAVQRTGKSGTVSLKLKIAPAQGTSNTLILSDTISVNEPKEKEQGSIFFPDDSHNLVRNDPEQHELPMAVDVARREPPVARAVDIQSPA